MKTDLPLEKIFRLTEAQKKALKRLGLFTVRDLLFYFPFRYAEATEHKNISDIQGGDKVTLFGRINNLKTTKGFRSKIPMTKATFEDATGKINLVWFHQPYIAKMIKEGSLIQITGKVIEGKNGVSIANPETKFTYSPTEQAHSLFGKNADKISSSLQAFYSESKGISSEWLRYKIKKILGERVHEELEDPIPSLILKKYHLPTLSTALVWIHGPQSVNDAQAARKRFAFEEIFFIQLERQKARVELKKNPSFNINHGEESVREFINRFPFTLTDAQERAISDVLADFKNGAPMSRLLEGDVGSGKTAVAAATAHAVVTSRPNKALDFGNLQTAIMAPTEILAKQHFESFIELFEHLPIQIGLITSSGCKKFPSKVNPSEATNISRTQLLKWVENGEIPILIGTHSLIQKTVKFKHLAYIIIDEQHRFGTKQRFRLTQKNTKSDRAPRKKKDLDRTPHLLSMTATPIPRTLALTIYGDLDLTLIDTMPPGRKPIKTEIIPEKKEVVAYTRARAELEAGRQIYVICPRIDEPDPTKERALNVKSVKEESARLKKEIFPDYSIEILHSKMRPKEKEEVMNRFSEGAINILVATSVVEVGVNVPNATTIIIEGSERFGLAQLHQLRGRVLRSTHQSYCFLMGGGKSQKTHDRIKALVTAKNGFELAEHDLMLRGPGELGGRKQWGISDLGMEAIKNIKMVEAARSEAQKILKDDSSLKKHPLIITHLKNHSKDTHFE